MAILDVLAGVGTHLFPSRPIGSFSKLKEV
jgi:hypothetical protein